MGSCGLRQVSSKPRIRSVGTHQTRVSIGNTPSSLLRLTCGLLATLIAVLRLEDLGAHFGCLIRGIGVELIQVEGSGSCVIDMWLCDEYLRSAGRSSWIVGSQSKQVWIFR